MELRSAKVDRAAACSHFALLPGLMAQTTSMMHVKEKAWDLGKGRLQEQQDPGAKDAEAAR